MSSKALTTHIRVIQAVYPWILVAVAHVMFGVRGTYPGVHLVRLTSQELRSLAKYCRMK